MAHRFRKSTGPTRLGKKARALMRWSLGANLVLLGTVAAIVISLSMLLLVLPTSELHAQTNSAPSVSRVSPSSPVSLTTRGSQTFQVSATDADNNLTKWEWEVDKHFTLFHGHQEPEETFTATGSITKSFSHTFPDNGTYTVTVTFTDSDGESGTAEWRAEVEDPPNRAPSVSRESTFFGWTGYVATGDVTFTAIATDPDDNLKSYEWFVDDISEDDGSWLLVLPTGAVTRTFTHNFPDAGTHTVKVTFTDDEGLSASFSWRVTAVEQLTVQFGADNYTVTEGEDREVEIPVTISGTPPHALQVYLHRYSGTATGLQDFSGFSGMRSTVVFSPSTSLTQTVPVSIYDDGAVETTEDFRVVLQRTYRLPPFVTVVSGPATVTIDDDDDEATVGFRSSVYRVRENSKAAFCVGIITGGVGPPFDVHFSYSDPYGALSSASTISSSVTFPHGGARGSVSCLSIDIGNVVETSEMTITLTGVTSATDAVSRRVKLGTPSTVTVEIIDNDRAFVVRVSPRLSRVSLEAGDSQTFTARARDGNNSISAYAWSVDGQEIDSGPLALTGDVTRSFTHTFPDDGTYTVLATFTDRQGDSSSRAWTVEVGDSTEPANRAPSVIRVSPSSSSVSLETGASRTFTARATDADANITSYAWTVNGLGVGNSGSLALTGTASQTFTHTFSSSGTHTVKATFTDDDGATGSASWTVGVAAPQQPTSNTAPSVSIASPVSPVRLETGEERTFTARGTDDEDNLTKWKWVVDKHYSPFDGHQEPEASFASTGRILKSFRHTFPDDGTYTVTVTFADSSGESDSEEWRVEVEDPPLVVDKSVTHTCGTEPATPKAGDRFTIASEVEAGEDLDDVFVRFDFSDPVRGMYDRARGREDPERDPEGSAYDISEGDTVRFTAPGMVSQEGDGWVLRCTVMREAGFLEGYINNNPRQLAVKEKAVTVSPYTQNPGEKDIGYFKSCGRIATEEGGKLRAEFIRKNPGMEVRVNASLFQDGERVWDGSAHKDAGSTKSLFTLTFAGQPELEGKYGLDCEMTVKPFHKEVSIQYLLGLCVKRWWSI